MKIKVEMADETIYKATKLVIKHCQDREFLRRIESQEQNFNHTLLNPKQVMEQLFNSSNMAVMAIRPYKSINPFSKAIGYAEDNIIYVNTRRLDLPLYDRIQNIYHEFCHVSGFTHKGNFATKYNMDTVPYKASKIFADYVKEIYG